MSVSFVFQVKSVSSFAVTLVFFDDLMILPETLEERKRTFEQLKSFYKIRENSDMKWFLGLRLQ